MLKTKAKAKANAKVKAKGIAKAKPTTWPERCSRALASSKNFMLIINYPMPPAN